MLIQSYQIIYKNKIYLTNIYYTHIMSYPAFQPTYSTAKQYAPEITHKPFFYNTDPNQFHVENMCMDHHTPGFSGKGASTASGHSINYHDNIDVESQLLGLHVPVSKAKTADVRKVNMNAEHIPLCPRKLETRHIRTHDPIWSRELQPHLGRFEQVYTMPEYVDDLARIHVDTKQQAKKQHHDVELNQHKQSRKNVQNVKW